MTKTILVLSLIVLAACGGASSPMMTDVNPSGNPSMDGGSIIYTKVPNPNDTLSVDMIRYGQDANRVVTSVTGVPVISLGTVPGQSWFVFAGKCPVNAQGVHDVEAVYTLYKNAKKNMATASINTQPTAFAVGLYVGTQLPSLNCFEFANCNSEGAVEICSFKPYSLQFN